MAQETRRVLVADGDATVRQQLFSAFLDIDVFSDCAATVTEAVGMLEAEQYGVAIVDIALPAGDVTAVIQKIAALPRERRPVVLVLASTPEAARTLDVDIVQIVLRRPIHLRQLVDVVRSCLRSFERKAVQPEIPPPVRGDQPTS